TDTGEPFSAPASSEAEGREANPGDALALTARLSHFPELSRCVSVVSNVRVKLEIRAALRASTFKYSQRKSVVVLCDARRTRSSAEAFGHHIRNFEVGYLLSKVGLGKRGYEVTLVFLRSYASLDSPVQRLPTIGLRQTINEAAVPVRVLVLRRAAE